MDRKEERDREMNRVVRRRVNLCSVWEDGLTAG